MTRLSPFALARRAALFGAAALLAATATQTAVAQDYPARTVRIVATEPGGGGDIVGRLVVMFQ